MLAEGSLVRHVTGGPVMVIARTQLGLRTQNELRTEACTQWLTAEGKLRHGVFPITDLTSARGND